MLLTQYNKQKSRSSPFTELRKLLNAHYGVKETRINKVRLTTAAESRLQKYLARAVKAYRDVDYFEALCIYSQVSIEQFFAC